MENARISALDGGGLDRRELNLAYMELSSLAVRGLCETCCYGKSTLLMLH